jgi:hydrogenase maturation factor
LDERGLDVNFLPIGKLPSKLLGKFLDKIKIEDERVILGPSIGEDVSVISFGDRLLVVKTDPVTFATDHIGWYVVNVNANDIATMGVRPRWFLASVLLPEQCNPTEAERIFDQILSACKSLDITLVGGHTEITHDLKRPIIVGCMLAEIKDPPLITTSGAKVGDDIVITKGIAIEGTTILAREAKASLQLVGLSENIIQQAADYLHSPGISVVNEALIACSSAKVSSMHDPTEGGLSSGLLEIAEAAQVGLWIEENKIPILSECKTICDKLCLDPLGLLASGSLIITLSVSETPRLLTALEEANVKAKVIGKVVMPEQGIKMHTVSGVKEMPQFRRDELARFLDSRSNM